MLHSPATPSIQGILGCARQQMAQLRPILETALGSVARTIETLWNISSNREKNWAMVARCAASAFF